MGVLHGDVHRLGGDEGQVGQLIRGGTCAWIAADAQEARPDAVKR